MAVHRGFTAAGIAACYTEASGGGAMFDINAPRNAPAKSPVDHLDKVIWHPRCFQYEIAAGPADVTIGHSALATKDTWIVVSTGGYGGNAFDPPVGSSIGFVIQGDTRVTDILLYAHGLGYVPKFMVALDGRRVPDGFAVQNDVSGGHRRVSIFANTFGIYLREFAVSTNTALPAVNCTYRVMLFRTRAPDPSKPLFAGSGGALQLGRGVIDTTRRYLRRTGTGDSPFALNLGPTIDIRNGAARSASGGVIVSEPRYNGSMAAPPSISVGV